MLNNKSRSISIRVSESFLERTKEYAEANRIPYTTFCRLAIARAIGDDSPITTADEVLLELKVIEPFLLALADLVPQDSANYSQKQAIRSFVERTSSRAEF